MSVKKRGAIPFEIEGQHYSLALTTNAMCRYQDKAGETMLAGLEVLQRDHGDLMRIRRIFWAALSEVETEEDAGDLIDAIGMTKAAEILGQAAFAAFPQPEADAAPAGKRRGVKPPRKTAAT
ncbi:MAG TPA: hypothetical protein DC031_01280 [Sulfitobacter sp.]|uniref:hypothetical protein n=1 Tax=Sulfitobacter TaxID=60136 RepID=UPI000C4FC637|nr:hypothetical protein [Sulfitobacter sp.]HBB81919.1 hypothetical protein [Sulfitobacter sp.]